VLVAEDNPVNQEVAVAVLELLGCQAEVVTNGQEAIKAAAHDNYDLVLMDCQMPVLDGFAATAAIRRQELVRGRLPVPIIALTANVVKGFREQCLAVGMNDYLGKPFEQEQLKVMLQRWLPTERTKETAGTAAPQVPVAVAEEDWPLEPGPLNQIRGLQRPGAPSLLAKVIGVYLDNSPSLVQALREAVARQDPDALMRAAHSLKSSSANLGAVQLAAFCKELEQRGREKCIENVVELLENAETQYIRVREALAVEAQRETQ
jgi:CheY-like chemotaxis protein